jgi:hypothetical protein
VNNILRNKTYELTFIFTAILSLLCPWHLLWGEERTLKYPLIQQPKNSSKKIRTKKYQPKFVFVSYRKIHIDV